MRKLCGKLLQILDGTPAVYGKHQRGQSLIEIAFITPLLVMLIAGMIEVGWYANNYQTLIEVTRVGARRGAVLSGDYSPLAWNNAASIVPYKTAGTPPVFWDDPSTNTGGDTATEAAFRDCANPNLDTDFGFYNLIVCNMLNSMDPLTLNDGNGIDDIVVSVFAVEAVNNDNPTLYQPSPLDDPTTAKKKARIYAQTYDFSIFNPYVRAQDRLPAGFTTVVVGRYPTNANECTVDNNNNILPNDQLIERDPFDYIKDDYPDSDALSGTPLELPGFDTGTAEYQRGFAWLGQHHVNNPDVNCWGSEWGIDRVQNIMNLPNFDLTGQEELRQLPPAEGLVLVEMFWEHHLLLQFPLFSPVLNILGSTPTISVWAAFPAPAAEPNIIFQNP